MSSQNHSQHGPHSNRGPDSPDRLPGHDGSPAGDRAGRSDSERITPEVLERWKSECEEFFTAIRFKLDRLASTETACHAAGPAPPLEEHPGSNQESVPGGHSEVEVIQPPSPVAASSDFAAQSDCLDGSLARLQEIRRQLAARLGKS